MKVHYSDDTITLHHGRSLDVLRKMPDKSIDCCVTSPPYFGLRSYLPEGHPDKASEIGTEKSPAEFVERLRELFAEVRRVLADDGTLWLNLGDSYNATPGQRKVGDKAGDKQLSKRGSVGSPSRSVDGLAAKNLIGIPWRVAFALQDDGWILRNSIIWHKRTAMPESVTDRLSTRHENLFLFSKSRRYWFDLDAIREPLLRPEALAEKIVFGGSNKSASLTTGSAARRTGATYGQRPQRAPAGKNPGDVWTLSAEPFAEAHFATFPSELPRRCILAGCKPGGTVLDPFSGSGTTGMVAQQLGREYVGIDISAEYLDLSLRTRLAHGTLNFGGDPA